MAPGRPTRPEAAHDRLRRFGAVERLVHWATAALVAVCMATALVLWVAPIATAVGRRALARDVHVVAGVLLPVPFALGALSGALRADVRRLNRFTADDWRWLRTLGRDPFASLGKFNPAQKLNASLTAGLLLVLLATGGVMRWFDPFPLWARTGATFVHDWSAVVLTAAVVVHVSRAVADRDALRGIVVGDVPAEWAARRAPRWATGDD